MPKEFRIQQSEEYDGEDWWTWAVWIEARSETLDLIDFVEWRLHPSFSNPIRRVHDRASNFRLTTGGWGVFQIVAQVQMKDGQQTKLRHYLELHYPDGTQE